MTPHDAIARLLQLGVSLRLEDLSKVEQLHISETATPAEYADIIGNMLPRTVTLNGALLAEGDIPALLHFPSLQGIVAHRIDFANSLLTQIRGSSSLRSIAMSHTSLTDADVGVLENHSRIAAIHFAGTKLTDTALKTFGSLPALELLDLRETLVTDGGLPQLQKLTNLFTIDVRGTAVTLAGAEQYRRSVAHILPDVEILV